MAERADQTAFPPGWKATDARLLAEGIGGRVWRVTLSDGIPAVVKQASSAAQEEVASGDDFLRWRNACGAVRLIARSGDLSLLEWAGSVRLNDHIAQDGDEAAAKIAGEVIGRLHSSGALPAPAALRPLEGYFASLFAKAGSTADADGGQHFIDAAALARRLLADQRDVKPLHGDIHHDNILLGSRGWLAIDPKGLIGDPAYDAANMFQNPVGSQLRQDPGRIASMAEIMAAATGRDVTTVLEYAFAYSGLAAAWWLEAAHRQAAESTLTIGRAIGKVLAQVRS